MDKLCLLTHMECFDWWLLSNTLMLWKMSTVCCHGWTYIILRMSVEFSVVRNNGSVQKYSTFLTSRMSFPNWRTWSTSECSFSYTISFCWSVDQKFQQQVADHRKNSTGSSYSCCASQCSRCQSNSIQHIASTIRSTLCAWYCNVGAGDCWGSCSTPCDIS